MQGQLAESDRGNVLVVAGFDPSGSAGLMADARTLEAVDAFGGAVMTAVTFQNASELDGFEALPVPWMDAQLDCLLRRVQPRAVKVGMLGSAAATRRLAERLPLGSAKVVCDPVIRATAGGRLVDAEGLRALAERLVPLCWAVTPNIAEAEALSGVTGIDDLEGMKTAASRIRALGADHVVVTGGHLPGDCVDVWYDGSRFVLLRSPRVALGGARGLGTLFSAALAGFIARGLAMEEALVSAKRLVIDSLLERRPSSAAPLMPAVQQHETAIEVLREDGRMETPGP